MDSMFMASFGGGFRKGAEEGKGWGLTSSTLKAFMTLNYALYYTLIITITYKENSQPNPTDETPSPTPPNPASDKTEAPLHKQSHVPNKNRPHPNDRSEWRPSVQLRLHQC